MSARDRGLGAMWLAIGMALFLSFAAMAVDVGNWYYRRTAVQSATDASALAGAALLPADPASAVAEAYRVALRHGFPPEEVEVTILEGSILEITITEEVDNFFLPAIGLDATTDIAATAVAEYEGNVAMGSPEAQIGNDPESGGSQPDFTLAVEGPGYTKINGDRFQPHNCGGGSVSYCDNTVSSPDIGNLEFDEDGYFFAVDVEATHGEDLVFEVFDPAYVALNQEWCFSSCSIKGNKECRFVLPDSGERSDLEALTALADYVGYDGGEIPKGWYNDDEPDVSLVAADDRYQSGRSIWCVGDQNGSTTALDTSIIIREPDNTPWNPLDNPPITQIGCEPTAFEGYGLDYTTGSGSGSSASLPNGYELLDPTNTTFQSRGEWKVDLTDGDWTLAEVWRRWVPVCRIPAPFVEQGKYLIQVRTVGSVSNPLAADLAKSETGLNAFSIRAGFDAGGSLVTYGDVNVYAEGHLPIFANSDSANPSFHLARVVEVGRERTLTVELFDIGDAGSLTMQVSPPPDSNMSDFTDCEFDLQGVGSPGTANSSNCSVSATSSFNGRVMLIQVPIPASYECSEEVETGCWVRLEMTASDIHDFTTWSAYISGDPVRLIE